VLADAGIPAPARRAVVAELFQSRVGEPALRLISFLVDADRAAEFPANLGWLVARTEAAGRNAKPVSEGVLNRIAAEERLDGYATAVLEPLRGEDELTPVEDDLFRFMRIVGGSAELTTALSDREVPGESRRALVEDLLRDKVAPTTLRLATYATQIGRPRDYPALLGYLVDRVALESNRRLAEVRAPIELDEPQRAALASALSRLMGRGVEIRVTVDPSVLAGFVATVGDTVIDGSARHRLETLKERLASPEATITTGDRS
jgi:F-type H+-transporting ATPase subunit delta